MKVKKPSASRKNGWLKTGDLLTLCRLTELGLTVFDNIAPDLAGGDTCSD